MTRSPARMWVLAGLAACALLALAGWLLVVEPQQAKSADHWIALSEAQAQSGSLRARNSILSTHFEEIEARRAALAVKQQSLPGSAELEALVRAITDAAASAGVAIEEVTPAEPIEITVNASGQPDSSSAAAGSPPEGGAGASSADAEASTGGSALYALPVTLRASGSLANLERFVRIVQNEQPRAILFTSLTMLPGEGSTALDQSVMLTAETRVFVNSSATAPAA